MLTNIPIDRILPHPKNPRLDLGDLTELAASIKERGILQNLTVVPEDPAQYKKMVDSKRKYQGNYIAVIGHRRHAAARLAELTEVPCTVAIMDDATQLATMLLENLQRADLTPYEQAQGFQMMMDLGETAVTIAAKTGFSKSTVYTRVKLLEFDPDKLKAAEARGGTLADYAALDKIKDPKTRAKVLDTIGTHNFNNQLRSAIEAEKRAKRIAKHVEQLEKFAKKVKSEKGYYRVTGFWNDSDKIEIPADLDSANYFFTLDDYSVTLYTDKEPEQKERVLSDAEKRENDREERLREIHSRIYQLRYEFVKGLSTPKVKKHLPDITEYMLNLLAQGRLSFDNVTVGDMLSVTLDKKKRLVSDELNARCQDSHERALLYAVYSGDSTDSRYYNWERKYTPAKFLDMRYDFLCKLGYEMSDEEKALRDGTHELFVREDAESEE